MDRKRRRDWKCLDLLEKTRGMGRRDRDMGTHRVAMATIGIILLTKQVDETGQSNTVLTLYELVEGESTASQGKATTGYT